MFRKMPVILLVLIGVIALTHSWIPLFWKEVLYGISLSIKSVIVFVLPFVIFGLLFKTAAQLSTKASRNILFIVGAICLSNFLSTMLSYGSGLLAYQLDLSMRLPPASEDLIPAFALNLPKWIGNGESMLLGLISGLAFGKFFPSVATSLSTHLEKIIAVFFRFLLYVIPLFIAGFVLKMCYDGVMGQIVLNYGPIFGLITVAVFSYIFLIYFLATRSKGSSFLGSVKNMMPAVIAGFGSMSSAAAMPLTILAAEKNGKNKDLARALIPATVNVHLIGDCFAIPIFAFAVLKSFGVQDPSFFSYVIFAGYFVLAKFSVAAVPGGGILVMLPVLESYLGFDAAMLSLITALYILFDPVITAANVLGNGGFALALDRILRKCSAA